MIAVTKPAIRKHKQHPAHVEFYSKTASFSTFVAVLRSLYTGDEQPKQGLVLDTTANAIGLIWHKCLKAENLLAKLG